MPIRERIGLNGNQLKLLAIVLMTMDHVGMLLFPASLWLRIVGRSAFPIFAYMIAEGCRYTRRPVRYLLTLLITAVPCQVAYAVAEKSAYQCVLVTFACSVALILLLKHAVITYKIGAWCLFLTALIAVSALYFLGRHYLKSVYFDVDYGLIGIALPLLIYIGRTFRERWLLTAVGLIALSLSYGGMQWWCLAALLPLMVYNGKRGVVRMKYFFYIYYPLHLAFLYAVAMWL